MKLKSLALLAAGCLSSLLISTALASPVTYTFTGFDWDDPTLTVAGWLTLDPALLPNSAGDGASYGVIYAIGSSPLGISASLSRADGATYSVFERYWNAADQYIGKNADGWNLAGVYINSEDQTRGASKSQNGSWSSAKLWAYDYVGNDSLLFDPAYAGNLDPTQPVNWLAPGTKDNGEFQGVDADGNYYDERFTLTSMRISSSVPEPASLALFAVALLAFGLSRRRA